eukprot:5353712-Alexandrium_andersonii.AAC.1
MIDENIEPLELVVRGRTQRERLAWLEKGGAMALLGARVTRRSKWIHFGQANNSVQLEVGDKRDQAIIRCASSARRTTATPDGQLRQDRGQVEGRGAHVR